MQNGQQGCGFSTLLMFLITCKMEASAAEGTCVVSLPQAHTLHIGTCLYRDMHLSVLSVKPCFEVPQMLPSLLNCSWPGVKIAALMRPATLQGFDVLFYGDSITMRWRDDWPPNQWGVGPPPPDTPGGTPMGVFNQTFRTNFTSEILGIGSES